MALKEYKNEQKTIRGILKVDASHQARQSRPLLSLDKLRYTKYIPTNYFGMYAPVYGFFYFNVGICYREVNFHTEEYLAGHACQQTKIV